MILRNAVSPSSRLWRHACAATALGTLLFFVGCNGCNSAPTTPSSTAAADPNGPDPALANLDGTGSAGQNGAVLGQSDAMQPQQSGETTQQSAPVADDYNANDNSYDQTDPNSEPVATSDQAPPPLPEYDQPAAPDPNYLWTPGYWGWGDNGYYWVPGEWVPPPYYGALWTPPYWGWCSVHYCFHRGYWGPHVGFYGGVDYGFGYVGFGFFGGYWQGNNFYYNRSVTNVGPSVRNYYQRNVVVNNVHYGAQPSNRVSYNGGHGGISVQPRPAEVAAMHENHAAPVPAQVATRKQAASNPQFAYNQNHGKPQTAAYTRPAGATAPHIAETPANVRPTPYNRPIEPTTGNRPGTTQIPVNRSGTPTNSQPQRNVPQQQQRPTPTPQQTPHPVQENHTTPQPQRATPTPQPRPTPQPQRAAPTPRPTPQPQRTAPEPQHTAPTPQRAAPAPRPAAPAPRPAAPAPRPAAPAPHPAAPAEEHPR